MQVTRVESSGPTWPWFHTDCSSHSAICRALPRWQSANAEERFFLKGVSFSKKGKVFQGGGWFMPGGVTAKISLRYPFCLFPRQRGQKAMRVSPKMSNPACHLNFRNCRTDANSWRPPYEAPCKGETT